jgi:hypothetical protein
MGPAIQGNTSLNLGEYGTGSLIRLWAGLLHKYLSPTCAPRQSPVNTELRQREHWSDPSGNLDHLVQCGEEISIPSHHSNTI